VKMMQWLKSFGPRHKIGFVRVWFRCLFFPPPPNGRFLAVSKAMKRPEGLLAIGGSLNKESLLDAYRRGIYPLFCKRPVKWWSNDPRTVLFLERMQIEHRGLRKTLKSCRYKVTFDVNFGEVIRFCSLRKTTWITPEVIDAFIELHHAGWAHSVEVWDKQGTMVGGLYGVDLGKAFTTESAFQRSHDTIRVAFAYLNCHLQWWGYVLNDMQTPSSLARTLGCEPIAREQYSRLLREFCGMEKHAGEWSVDQNLDVGGWIPEEPGSQCIDPPC